MNVSLTFAQRMSGASINEELGGAPSAAECELFHGPDRLDPRQGLDPCVGVALYPSAAGAHCTQHGLCDSACSDSTVRLPPTGQEGVHERHQKRGGELDRPKLPAP